MGYLYLKTGIPIRGDFRKYRSGGCDKTFRYELPTYSD